MSSESKSDEPKGLSDGEHVTLYVRYHKDKAHFEFKIDEMVQTVPVHLLAFHRKGMSDQVEKDGGKGVTELQLFDALVEQAKKDPGNWVSASSKPATEEQLKMAKAKSDKPPSDKG